MFDGLVDENDGQASSTASAPPLSSVLGRDETLYKCAICGCLVYESDLDAHVEVRQSRSRCLIDQLDVTTDRIEKTIGFQTVSSKSRLGSASPLLSLDNISWTLFRCFGGESNQ